MTARRFESLSSPEVMALAIHIERCNARRLHAFAGVFREYDPALTARFEELAAEEQAHEALLAEQFHKRFGPVIPVIEEADVAGVIESFDLDDGEHLVFDSLQPERAYELVFLAEQAAEKFYQRAAAQANDAELRALYEELARMEGDHAARVDSKRIGPDSSGTER